MIARGNLPTMALLAATVLAPLTGATGTSALFQSTDRGRSWHRADAGLPPGARINALGSIQNVLLAGSDAGLYVSLNQATDWSPARIDSLAQERVLSLATTRTTVFAGTDGSGLLRSVDQGATWNRDAAFRGRTVRCLLALDDRTYAGTDTGEVFVAGHGEPEWTAWSEGLPVPAQVFALVRVSDRVCAALYARGLFIRHESAPGWNVATGVSPLALAGIEGVLVAGHNPGGLYWSEDLGGSWFKARESAPPSWLAGSLVSEGSGELQSSAPVWALAAGEDLVVAGVANGIYISYDQGRTWERARTGLPANSPGVAFLITEGRVFAAVAVTAGEAAPGVED